MDLKLNQCDTLQADIMFALILLFSSDPPPPLSSNDPNKSTSTTTAAGNTAAALNLSHPLRPLSVMDSGLYSTSESEQDEQQQQKQGKSGEGKNCGLVKLQTVI